MKICITSSQVFFGYTTYKFLFHYLFLDASGRVYINHLGLLDFRLGPFSGSQRTELIWLLNLNFTVGFPPSKKYEKCFLFHIKSSFRSQDI